MSLESVTTYRAGPEANLFKISIPMFNGVIRQSRSYVLTNGMAAGSYPLLEAARGGGAKLISPLELLTNLKVFCCVFYGIVCEFFCFLRHLYVEHFDKFTDFFMKN